MARARIAKSFERVHRLWDELTDFNASQEEAALTHALSVLAALVNAKNAYWLGAVRIKLALSHDPLRGWRPRAIHYLHQSPADRRFYQQSVRNLDAGRTDETTRAHAAMAGTFRASLLRELVTPAWFETPFYDMAYRARGLVDAIFVISPVNRDAESYFAFQRGEEQGLFTRRERDLVAYALRPLKTFHRQMMLCRGLMVAHTPLTPMEQRVARLLLTELSEKEIALRLALTPRTAHSYVTQIFRKFGVSGRAGLTALWLGPPR